MDLVLSQLKSATYPFNQKFPFYVLFETASLSAPNHQATADTKKGDSEMDRIFKVLEKAGDLIIDGVIPQDIRQAQQIWFLREEVANACISYGYCFKYDVSLPAHHYYKIIEETRKVINESPLLNDAEKQSIITVGYGHIGDGNLHLNVTLKGYSDKDLQARVNTVIDHFVMEYTRDVKGSVSAEHGVGLQKTGYLAYSKSKEMIAVMKTIKKALDPNGILNPYKVLA